MTERPLPLKAPQVRAILAGATQLRIALKYQPLDILPMKGNLREVEWVTLETREPKPAGRIVRCRFGVPGDQLWVRETFVGGEHGLAVHFRATEPDYPAGIGAYWPWRPNIHMPRAASRITLEIVSVRAQRLQDISYRDALAEGAPNFAAFVEEETIRDGETGHQFSRRMRWPQRHYSLLWNSINGAGSWEANPWVWAITHRRIK